MNKKYTLPLLSLTLLCTAPIEVNADGLTDLTNALKKLEGKSPVSATVESAYTEKRGKRKKLKTKTGLIQVNVNDSHLGFQLTYNNDILAKLEQESKEKEQDEEINTPTLNAIHRVGLSNMRDMLSAAPGLLRFLNKAEFIDEQWVEHEQKQVRQLNFDLPLEAIIENKEVHEYVDEFNGKYHILIDENGVPIESSINFEGNGSAYIFFTMELSQTDTTSYQLIDDRLVNVKQTFQHTRSSTWGDTESSGYNILIVNPKNYNIVSTQ